MTRSTATEARRQDRSQVAAAILLGIGLGGLFDGIVLHQVLQWHHMISGPVPPTTLAGLEDNTLADGLFHVAGWALTVAGLSLLLVSSDGRRRADGRRWFFGGLLFGWGAFDLVEGLVDHYLLRLHHVRPGPDQEVYDLAYLFWGAAMIVAGWWLMRTRARAPSEVPEPAARA